MDPQLQVYHSRYEGQHFRRARYESCIAGGRVHDSSGARKGVGYPDRTAMFAILYSTDICVQYAFRNHGTQAGLGCRTCF